MKPVENEQLTITPERRKRYKKDLANMRLFDDDFFNQCMQDNPKAALFLIRVLMQKPDLELIGDPEVQKTIKTIGHHSLRLDLYSKSEKRVYNVEIQRSDKGAGARRTRHHRSMIEVSLTVSGDDNYDDVPDIYVIFITEHDIWGDGAPFNLFEMTDNQHGHKLLDDGDHVLYVNGEYDADDDFGRLMHDFRCVNPHEIYNKELRDAAIFLKETEKGVEQMCQAMERIWNDSAKEAEKKANEATARRMIRDGVLSPEKISEYSSVPLDRIKELKEEESLVTA